MSKKMKQLIMALLVIIMSISILAVPAAAEDLSASLEVEVKVEGYCPDTMDTYKIIVTPGDPSFPMPAGGTNGVYEIQGVGTKTLVFEYQKLGVYTYTITQGDCGNSKCYTDDSIFDLTVYVVNAENPTQDNRFDVIATLKIRDGEEASKPQKVVFTNKYAKPAELEFVATKIYNGKTPKSGLFHFQLKDGKGNLIETVSNVGKNVTFSPIIFNEVGTYTYKIYEVIDKRPGVIFDKSVYFITVQVMHDEENQGDYEIDVTYRKNGKIIDADDLIFINKSETGGLPFTGDQFRLVLWSSIMLGSLVAVVILLIIWKKRKR